VTQEAVRRKARRAVRVVRRAATEPLLKLAATRPLDDPAGRRLEQAAAVIMRASRAVETLIFPRDLLHERLPSVEVERRARPLLDRLEWVDRPLVLFAQAGRSGGTLLLQLFDGHEACLVVPHELGVMLPVGSLARAPKAAFASLTPPFLYNWNARGIKVGKESLTGRVDDLPPFELEPQVLERLLAEAMRQRPPHSDREVLDAYLTAYFNAWEGGPRPLDRRWVVGFEPAAISNDARMRCFEQNYPDGRVVTVLRDPWSWYASARRWSARFTHADVALRYWLRAADASLAYRERHPETTLLVSFKQLVADSHAAVGRICAFLDIPLVDAALRPTVNGLPARANSSFAPVEGDVSEAPATRGEDLSAIDRARVDELAEKAWNRVLAVLPEAA
jgi:hypothetical protein